MDLSLIIPCYNEEKNVPFLCEKLEILLEKNIEVILVDNGSTDHTLQKIREFKNKNKSNNLKILSIYNNIGYGNGILAGLKVARGEILSWTHADMQTDPKDVLNGLKFFKNRNDKIFVKGLRNGRSLKDRLFTIGMSIFCSIILNQILWDINAQPTIFTKTFFDNWVNPPDDFSLDLYAYNLARKNDYKIRRFDVNFNKRLFGLSNWNVDFPSKLKFIKRTVRFTFKLTKSD